MNEIKILHITNDYSGSTVYKNLVGELDKLGIVQIVYCPIKSDYLKNKNLINLNTSNSEIIYSQILNTSDRLLYPRKIKKICIDIELRVDIKNISLIHAHTWYSDGGVAYQLSKKYSIPYILAIRNTDLNLFHKYAFYLRDYGFKILNNSSKIIFITAIYKKRFFSLLEHRKYENKCVVIPNGVDNFWIQNFVVKKKIINKTPQLLFVGRFSSGKNLELLIKAISLLNKQGVLCDLHLVGGGGDREKQIISKVKEYHFLKYHGIILDKHQLKLHFRSADIFTMPSKSETFGLVYVEAMLQGLPILYTKNEGIDEFYLEKIGEKVKSGDVKGITQKLFEMISNYENYYLPTDKLLENHNWSLIAQKYIDLYGSII